MPERPLSILTKGERSRLAEDVTADALVLHYEDVYSSRFRWLEGPEGMDPSWPERMIFRHGLLGTAKAFGAWQLCGGNVGLRGIYGQALNYFPTCDNTSEIPEGWTDAHEGPTVRCVYVPQLEVSPLCARM